MPKGHYDRSASNWRPTPLIEYAPELVQAVRSAYESGMSMREVAQEVGVSVRVLQRLMPRHGIDRRPTVTGLSRQDRFLTKIRVDGTGCWIWTAALNPWGYGQFWDRERRTMDLAHRVSYELFVGPLGAQAPKGAGPIGDVIAHRCDVPSCVNPEHLFLTTQQGNMDDMVQKGRQPNNRGERNPNRKLTPDQVAEIRSSVTGRHGERMAIARQYGISSGHVSKILQGDVWT